MRTKLKTIALIAAALGVVIYGVFAMRARAREAAERETKCALGIEATRAALDSRQWDLVKARIESLNSYCDERRRDTINEFSKRLQEDPIFAELTAPIDGIWAIYEQLPKSRDSLKQSYQAALARLPSEQTPMTARVAAYIQSEYHKRAIPLGLTGDPTADRMSH